MRRHLLPLTPIFNPLKSTGQFSPGGTPSGVVPITYQDDFNRPDESLGASPYWTVSGALQALVVSNQLLLEGSGVIGGRFVKARWVYEAPYSDVTLSYDLINCNGTSLQFYTYIRMSADELNSYRLTWQNGGFGGFQVTWSLDKIVAGVVTSLASDVTDTDGGSGGANPIQPAPVEFSAIGSTITVVIDGVTRFSVSDSSIPGPGYVMFHRSSNANTNTVTLDNMVIS